MDGAISHDEVASKSLVADYLAALSEAGFSGGLCSDTASRVACATDNSIYQIMPQAVVHPHDGTDLELVAVVAARLEFAPLKLYPRGGGTSTNGQSLGPGIVVDTSRHMCGILDFDTDSGLVTVEPGLVRDRLNDFLAQHGRFFAPHVSTTSRATLSGMTGNDSSGKGSLVYGKTSDHIESLELVLPGGEVARIGHVPAQDLPRLNGATGRIARAIDAALAPHEAEIQARFPEMKRGFTGYNLKEARAKNGDLNLAKLVAGSEGTLGLIKSITLRTKVIPAHTMLAVLVYSSHEAGLRAVPGLLEECPQAIEFIDDKILGAALHSPFAQDVREVLGISGDDTGLAAHFFEISGENADVLTQRLTALQDRLTTLSDKSLRPIGIKVLKQPEQIARVWEIRRACQGLLAGFDRNKRAVAFIEDCAVPPENMAPFVADLEDVLKSKNIPLGMYGHADVGCVHIRPLMNLTAEDERRQIRVISDAVFDLTRKHGGLLWGEHGKGLRGEYSETVIGSDLFRVMREIKGIFDPDNRMNPGKIARPLDDDTPLIALDAVDMRGAFDEQITPALRREYANMLRCDGNSACFNQDEGQAFCPSYKATGDRRLSPKTRAGMLREWALAQSTGRETGAPSMDLKHVLDSCLSCKACASASCPAQVDIPQMKAQFLDWYHRGQRRPVQDHVVAYLETLAPLLDRIGSGLLNWVQSMVLIERLMSATFGLVDLPKIRSRRMFQDRLRQLDVKTLTAAYILTLPRDKRNVVIVQDCFTSFYDADVVLAQVELVRKLGFTPILLTYRAGGKPLHVKGFLHRFKRVAMRNARDLAALDKAGLPLIGVDGATTLMYRHEYTETLPDCPDFTVQLLSEWLKNVPLPAMSTPNSYKLIQHCTERALLPETSAQWAQVFARAGIDTQIIKAGCCGMSGLFGHELVHQNMSRTLYDQSWRGTAEGPVPLIATGYSCRSQVKRLSNIKAFHPAQVLLANWPQ